MTMQKPTAGAPSATPEQPVATPPGDAGQPEVSATSPEQISSPAPSQSPTLKIGEKDYTASQISEAIRISEEIEDFNKQHGDWKSLKSEFTKRSTEISELKSQLEEIQKQQQSQAPKSTAVSEVLAGIKPKESLTQEERQELEYLENLGVVTSSHLKKVIEDQQSKIKELEGKLTDTDKKLTAQESEKIQIKVNSDISGYIQTTGHEFVKPEEVWEYLNENAKQGRFLSPQQAIREKYLEQIVAAEVAKNAVSVPATEPTVKSPDISETAGQQQNTAALQTGSKKTMISSLKDEFAAYFTAANEAGK